MIFIMKNRIKAKLIEIFIGALITLLIPSCNTFQILNKLPGYEIDQSNINSQIIIYAPDGWNTFKIGDPISFAVDVMCDDPIIFSRDYNIAAYRKSESTWVEIDTVPEILNDGEILLYPISESPFNNGTTSIFPIIEDQTKQMKLRVVVVGHLYKNGEITDQLVGAYTDVKLYP